MRVPTHTASTTTIELLQKLAARQAEMQTRIATGQRIALPSDDPAAVGRVIGREADARMAAQFEKNARTAQEISQVSFEALDQLRAVSDRASELATLSGGAASTESLQAYAKEVNQLIEHALQLGNSSFGGQFLFGGTEVKSAPFDSVRDADGRLTGVHYVGQEAGAAVRISETSSVIPRTSGDTNRGIGAFIDQLVALRDAMEAGNPEAIGMSRDALRGSEDLLIGAISDQGAVQMRIEVNLTLQRAWQENIERLVSADADIEVPSALVRLNQATVSYEAALSASSRILNLSILDYIR